MNKYSYCAASALGVVALSAGLLVSVSTGASAATAPSAPTAVTGAVGNASSLVSWTAPTDDGGSPLRLYEIDWSPPSGTVSSTSSLAPSESATAMWLLNGTAITFTVKAENEDGLWGPSSAPSDPVTPENICTITGTNGPDVLTGTPGNDAICGLGGDDVIDGGGGDDTLIGGAGHNTVDFADAPQQVYVDLLPAFYRPTSGYAASGADVDNLQQFNGVTGSAFDDNIYGTNSADKLVGGDGNDILVGWGGNDTLNGGRGNDQLVGYGGADKLIGGPEDDLLAPGGQVDTVYGGPGSDTLSVSGAASPVTVNLTDGTSTGQGGTVDTFLGVENAIGSRFADTLIGSSADNSLKGGAGDDTLSGLAGSDHLDGGDGVDSCDGGTDTDTATACETTINVP